MGNPKIFFYIFICLIISIISTDNKITLYITINDTQTQYRILGEDFNDLPSVLHVNEQNLDPAKEINLDATYITNIIEMIWNQPISNCSKMFKSCNNIESIDLTNFNFLSVSNFSQMFSGCRSLKSIDLSFLNNLQNNINISNMLSNCTELKSVDLSHLNLPFVNNTNDIFNGCVKLESIDLSYIKLPKIKSFQKLFANLTSLRSVNLTNIDIPNLVSIDNMFENCTSLKSIDLSFINNSFIANMNGTFRGCNTLESVDFSNIYLKIKSFDMSFMFFNCTALTSVDFSNFNLDNSYIDNNYNPNYMDNMFSNCIALKIANFSFFLTNNIKNKMYMGYMFSNCKLLESVDFSNFNSLSSKNLSYIFYDCISLKSVDLSPINQIITLDSSFYGCSSLKSINLPNFNSVTNSSEMFSRCSSLISMDLSKLNTKSLLYMEKMFYLCTSLIDLNLENLNLEKVIDMNQMFYKCDSLIFVNFNNIKANSLNNMNQMFYECDSLTSLDLSYFKSNNIINIDQLFYKCNSLENLNLTNFKTTNIQNMEQLFYDCNSLESLDLSSFDTKKVTNMKEMFSGCSSLTSLNLSNFNFTSVSNVDNMFSGCSNLDYINIYNFQDINGANNMFNGVKVNLVFCIGDESRAENAISILRENNCSIGNCSDNYKDSQKKWIDQKNICIDKCYEDETYRYQYKDKCYEICPEGYSPNKETYVCEKICELIINFITKEDNECVYIFDSKAFYLGEYEIVYSNIELVKYIIDKTLADIKNSTLDSLLLNVTNEDKHDYLIKGNNEIYHITSSYNQNNKEYNNTKILLGECEKKLKEANNIDINDTLIIYKLEYFVEGLNIPIVKFDVFSPNTKAKLDLNICENVRIISPVSNFDAIDENNLFKYDPKSDYFNDICFPYTTENETDIVLFDRKNEYNKKNMSLCQKNCNFIEYNFTTKKVLCECDMHNKSPLQLDDIINKDKLLNNFVDIQTISNINILKCYNTLFSENGLKKNIGNYIILSIIFLFVISTILFVIKGYVRLIDKINQIIQMKKSENKDNDDNIDKKEIDEKEKNEKEKIEEELLKKKIIEDIMLKLKNPPKKIVKKKKKKVKAKKKVNLISTNSSAIKLEKSNELNQLNEINKNEKDLSIVFNEKNETIKKDNKNKKIKKNDKKKDISILDINNNDNKDEQKTEDFINYNDYELNSFSYKEALEKDRRTFLQYYISLVKIKHLLIFSFYPINDYNSQIIKICLFFFSFSLNYIVNALFFNDETMHKIYEDEGIFNFIYLIPPILYSTIISSIINIIIKTLSLSESNIVKIKKEENLKKATKLVPKVKKCLHIKFILFFIISFMFLGLFWYYISCFGAVYKNTQIHLLSDTLISFALSLIYPFIIYLFIALLRYLTLNKKEKFLNFCYIFSKIIT